MSKLRPATLDDVPALADLAELRRAEYAHYEPGFWRPAATARLMHTPFLASLLEAPDVSVLIAERHGQLDGFIAARRTAAPPALRGPGGLVLVDDFAVRRRGDWSDAGRALLEEVVAQERREPALLVVVCAHRDRAKAALLEDAGLAPACAFRLRRLGDEAGCDARVRLATPQDAPAVGALAARARPRPHGMQLVWKETPSIEGYRRRFAESDLLCLVTEGGPGLVGYALAKPGVPSPPVYDPGGTTCFVDELELAPGGDPAGVAERLLGALEVAARQAGDVQLLVTCGRSERVKRDQLDARRYRWPADWYSRRLPARTNARAAEASPARR